jgi:hypothetical protein
MSPWPLASILPFRCLPPATFSEPSGFMVSGWQVAQEVRPDALGWPVDGAGGSAWQEPQITPVAAHAGEVAEPWQ